MKKFLLMFAAVAAIAFVGCKTETKPAEEVVEEAPVAEYTVDGVAADLMNCADEAAAWHGQQPEPTRCAGTLESQLNAERYG